MKGDGGRARWEERKGVGVGDMDNVDRMVLLVRCFGGLNAPSMVVMMNVSSQRRNPVSPILCTESSSPSMSK